MYKIIIVDDEKYIRKSIMNRVDWQRLGLTVAAEAGNGIEALELLKNIRPEIILVDIRMPRMDGLEFIAEAKKILPSSSYVVMSAYHDFAYAKKAIQLGVEDYILKPVEEEELSSVISAIVHRFNEIHLTRRLIRGSDNLNAHWFLAGREITAVALYLKDDWELDDYLAGVAKREWETLIPDGDLYYLNEYSRSNCYVFLLTGNQLDMKDVQILLERVWNTLDNREGAVAHSPVYIHDKADDAVRNCIDLLKRKMFYPERKILLPKLMSRQGAERERQEDTNLNDLYHYRSGQDGVKLEARLRQAVDAAIQECNSIKYMEHFISEFELLLRYIIKEQHNMMDVDIIFHEFRSKDYLLAYETVENLKESLNQAAKQIINSLGCQDSDIIFVIKSYIQEHFADNLNSADIAKKFFLNSSYFSTLFKEKAGMNFTAYVEGIRMEKAKEQLVWTSKQITDVALDVGYSDSSYFSKVFKRYFGMTPRQYREHR